MTGYQGAFMAYRERASPPEVPNFVPSCSCQVGAQAAKPESPLPSSRAAIAGITRVCFAFYVSRADGRFGGHWQA